MANLVDSIPAHVFRSRSVSAHFELRDRRYELHLELPDLQQVPKRVWADWGPMCTCELPVGYSIRVAYTDVESGEQASYVIAPPQLAVNSPMSASVRRMFPLYIQVCDAPRSLNLRIFLDAEGETQRVQATETDAQVRFADVIFREKLADRLAG